MLADICELVILGHSERRNRFGETDQFVNLKVRKALEFGLQPILCVGEQHSERMEGREEEVVSRSLVRWLEGVEVPHALLVAYEPVWAIGTGLAATSEQAQAMSAFIRLCLTDLYGHQAAEGIPILYGGSVSPENVVEFISLPDVDGALVGGASLDIQKFTEIVRVTAQIRSLP